MADIRKYELVPIGLEYLKAGDVSSAKVSLEKMLKAHPGFDEDKKILLESTNASEEGITHALSKYGKLYLDSVKDANLEDFWDIYQEEFGDGEKRIYHAKLAPLASKKLKEVEEEIKIRQDKMKDIADNNASASDAEIQTLNVELNQYKEAYSIIQSAQGIRKKSLQLKISSEAMKNDIKDDKSKMRRIIGI